MDCNFIKTLMYLGTTILYCSDFAISSKPEEYQENQINRKQLELPNLNVRYLDVNRQKIIEQLRQFASEYTQKAYEISKLPSKEKLSAGKLLEQDFMKNYQKMEFQIKELQRGPPNSGGSRFDITYKRSIMSDLYAFLRAIFELPMKIHCLIFGCPDKIKPTSTTSTSMTTTVTTEATEAS